MLKEKRVFPDDLPISVTVAQIDDYPLHFHEELEIAYVLSGRVDMRNGYYSYQMKQGDVFIFNDREIHSFDRVGDEENMVMLVHLDLEYYGKYYENLTNNFFVTDMDDDDESLDMLKSILARIMMELLKKGNGYEHRIIEKSHNLLGCIMSDFQYFLMEDGKFVNENKKKENKILTGRLNRITDYMYENYNRKLTLNEIAEKEHLSLFYLSHVIKEATGLSFQDLLNFIRVEESEKLLLGTNKKIGTIADECGFSALRYFVKHFEQWFGMHPSEYREKFAGKVSSRESMAKIERSTPIEIERAIRDQVKGVFGDFEIGSKIPPVIVSVNKNNEVRSFKLIEPIFNIMEKGKLHPLCDTYNQFKKTSDIVIACGENYVITTDDPVPEKRSSYNILLYSLDKKTVEAISKAHGSEEIKSIVEDIEDGREFLIRFDELSGPHTVARFKVTRESILTNLEYMIKKDKNNSFRDAILKKWKTFPKVDVEASPAVDSLSVRSFLKGGEGELILIDKA